jgi:ubiquinone/menaquinone biosynthesis C-methylase UbiE
MGGQVQTATIGKNLMPEQFTDNEQKAAVAFGKQAPVFDDQYRGDTIIQYKRQRVRALLQQALPPQSQVLELNSGTGEDAIWLAQQGHRIHATDISPGMQAVLQEKVTAAQLTASISTELCSFTQLEQLQRKGPYDCIFSNFAGLNCTGELHKVLASFDALLVPGGKAVLVVLPKFCLWEFLLLFRGKCKTAFRRLLHQNGAPAHLEGQHFTCWYYNPSYIQQQLGPSFKVINLEGLCTLVPPSYIAHFAERHPKLYQWLRRKEDKWRARWPWKYWGDYYIIVLEKR